MTHINRFCGPQTLFILMRPEGSYFLKMWPLFRFVLETPVLLQSTSFNCIVRTMFGESLFIMLEREKERKIKLYNMLYFRFI